MRKASASILSKLTLPDAGDVEAVKVQILAYLLSGVRSVSAPQGGAGALSILGAKDNH